MNNLKKSLLLFSMIFILIGMASAVCAQDSDQPVMDDGMSDSDINQNEKSVESQVGDNSDSGEVLTSIQNQDSLSVPISDNLPTVESGSVSGGVDITAKHPWAPSDPVNGNKGNITYVIPANATDIKFAYVYVTIYSGSASPSYGSISDTVIITENGTLNKTEVLWVSSGTTDGVHYILNDHVVKCYSDYMIFYNITDMVQGLQGTEVSVDVLSKPLSGKQFDGRIKLISLVLAYDDGDSDVIDYWFNEGQAWTDSEIYSYFSTKNTDLSGDYNATLINIALSSNDGQYILNDMHLFDEDGEYIQGDYYQYHRWNVNEYMVEGETTELKYISSKDGWASFKSVMALLTIQTPPKEPVIPKIETLITVVEVGDDSYPYVKYILTEIGGSPIANATVLYSVNKGQNISCNTSEEGTFVVENLAGNVEIFVNYEGNETYSNSTNLSSFSFKIIKSSTKIEVISIDGLTLELTAILKDDKGNKIDNANVYYTLNDGNKVNVTTDNGEFIVNAENNCVINMVFEGDDYLLASNSSITLKNINPVQKGTEIQAENPFTRTAVDYKAGERGYMFYFYLKDEDGKVLPNKKVKIGIDGKIYTVTTDKDGKAGQMINMANENSYTYALSFLGDDDYKASFAVSRLIVVKKSVTITPAKTSYSFKTSAKTKTITATLKSTNSYIPKGKQVTLTIAGKTFKATIGDKGQISLNIGSVTAKGTYKVAIKFAGTVTYAAATSSTITVKIS